LVFCIYSIFAKFEFFDSQKVVGLVRKKAALANDMGTGGWIYFGRRSGTENIAPREKKKTLLLDVRTNCLDLKTKTAIRKNKN